MQSLKSTHPHVKEVASGTVSLLAGGEMQPSTKVGSIVKPALICYAGVFDGMYGEVNVTDEILQGLAERYNREKENPQNENAYAPILTDHVREVDRVKGRLLCGLTVQPWTNPSTNETTMGLYGTLRIDDQDAQKKVDDGSYAHVSISFDEETFELFEISFVAVEAARGAMVLSQKNSQGGKMELSKKFASLSQKHKALAADVKLKRAARQVSLQKIKTTKDELRKTLSSLSARQVELKAKLRGAQLKAQMNGFVVAGKVNPSELTKMDFKALGALPQHAVDVLLASYESRQVSTDVYQYGQSGSSLVKEPTTKAEMAEAIKLQKAGKRISLSDRIVDEKPVDDAKAKLEGEEGEDSKKKINHDDMKDILAEMDEHHAKVGEAMDKLKSLGEETDKMDGEDKKEEEHLSDDEGEDLAKEDDEDGKPKDKKEEK